MNLGNFAKFAKFSGFKIQDSEGNSLNPKPWVLMKEVWKEDLDSKSFCGNLDSEILNPGTFATQFAKFSGFKIQDSERNSLNPKPWVLLREVWKEDLDSNSFCGNLES